MTNNQKLYFEIKKLNEIINTPVNIFKEKAISEAEEIMDSGANIEFPKIENGIDYKMKMIKFHAKCLEEQALQNLTKK